MTNNQFRSIPFAPEYFVDSCGHWVIHKTKLGTFPVYSGQFYIGEDGLLTSAVIDRGMLWNDSETQLFRDPEFNPETEQWGMI